MSDERRDDDLRAAFSALREGVERSSSLPDFATMMDRARFAELRDEVEGADGAPDFQTMIARARARVTAEGATPTSAPVDDRAGTTPIEAPRSAGEVRPGRDARPKRRLGSWVPLAAAAALAGLLWIGGPGADGDDEFERLVAGYSSATAGWRSPTASLMEIPGVDLGSVPSIGTSFDGIALPDTDAPEGRDS